jgi:hypothetical protein
MSPDKTITEELEEGWTSNVTCGCEFYFDMVEKKCEINYCSLHDTAPSMQRVIKRLVRLGRKWSAFYSYDLVQEAERVLALSRGNDERSR